MANPVYVPLHSRLLCTLLTPNPCYTNIHSYIFEKHGFSRAAAARKTSWRSAEGSCALLSAATYSRPSAMVWSLRAQTLMSLYAL